MAKTAEKTDVAVLNQGGVPAALVDRMKADSGKGVSMSSEDSIIPMIYLLQANSPQVKSRDPKYIEGARDGDIWMRNSVKREVVSGDEGFLFQPCYFSKAWIEWKPQRGGFVARHDERPGDAVLQQITTDTGDTRPAWVRPNGNIVQDVREHFGFADDQPYMISFSSTGHTVSREWMTKQKQFTIPGTRDVAPAWSRKYKFKTTSRSNARGQSWSQFKIEDAGWVETAEEYERGQALYESLERGEKRGEDYAAPEVVAVDDKIPF